MILKRLVIDGKEIFIPVSKKELKDVNVEDLLFTDEKEKNDFIDNIKKEIEVEILSEEESKPKEEFKESIDDKIKRFSEKIEVALDKAVESTTQGVKSMFNSFNKKNKVNKILSILPFMSEDDIHELVEQIIAQDEQVKDLPLEAVMPFLSSKDCNRIFINALNNNSYKCNLIKMAPFVNEETLDVAVDLYIEGKLDIDKIDQLYPFLSEKSIKKIFKKMMSEN